MDSNTHTLMMQYDREQSLAYCQRARDMKARGQYISLHDMAMIYIIAEAFVEYYQRTHV